MRSYITVGATALWAVSLTLMVAASTGDRHTLLAHWAILTGLWACVFTGWGLLLCERHRVETIAAVLLQSEDAEGLRSC